MLNSLLISDLQQKTPAIFARVFLCSQVVSLDYKFLSISSAIHGYFGEIHSGGK
jgi:hypothetical protein